MTVKIPLNNPRNGAVYEFCGCLKALCVNKSVSCVKFEEQGMRNFIVILFYVVIHTPKSSRKSGMERDTMKRMNRPPTLFFVVFCSQLAPSQN